MNIYFVRHSITEYTVIDHTRPLSIDGLKKLVNLEDYFKDINIHKMYSSPYKRAIDTIRGIAIEKSLKIDLIDDLRERKVSDTFVEDFIAYANKQWLNFDFKLPKGESLNETKERAIKEIEKILDSCNNEENIIIGTHGTILSLIIYSYDNNFGYTEWQKLKMPEIIKMNFENNIFISYEKVNIKEI